MNKHDLLIAELMSRPEVKAEVERILNEEREACAKICDDESKTAYHWKDGLAFGKAAKMIRARSK